MNQNATLSEHQLDALREFGNIGSAHAATSLSMMICQDIEMRVPEIEIVPLTAVSSFVDTDGPAVGLYFQLLDGDCRLDGHVYLVFPEDSALKMSDMLLMREVGATSQIAEDEQSALMEVGNVLLSSFGDASAELLGITMLPSPPEYRFGMARGLIDDVAHSVNSPAARAIVFKTALSDTMRRVKGYFVLLPEPRTLDSILGLLEAKTNGGQ
jgi:Chemotaxis protein CheC, inhibitor of MCP methylation